MSLEAIIIAAWPFDNQAPAHPDGTHPDDKCYCGTTGNGAKPAAPAINSWFWRGATYNTGTKQRRVELRSLQGALDYWASKHRYPHQLRDLLMQQLFDRAVDDSQLHDAIMAHLDGKPVEYKTPTSDAWLCNPLKLTDFYPSFDATLQWRPAPPPKPKRPHADLIEKHLEDVQWFCRSDFNGRWNPCDPSFNAGFEYKVEPKYCEKRKAMVRDWLSGTEYEFVSNEKTANAHDLLRHDLNNLRKKPTTKKLRIRTAVMKSTLSGGLPFTMSAMTDEQEAHVASLKQFIRWMGPWQETEVEISKA